MKRLVELFAIDTRTLALLRVCVGVLTIVDVSMRARDLTAHYTDAGVLPRAVAISGHIPHLGPSFHFMSGDFGVQALLFGLLLALGFLDLLFLGHLARAFGAGDLGFGFLLGALFGARTGRGNGFIAWRSGFEFFQLGQLGFGGGLGAVFVIGEFEHRALF